MFLVRGNSFFKHFLNTTQSVCLPEKSIIRNMCSTRPVQRQRPILYGDEASPPVRFAMITAALVSVDIEFHNIDLFKHENRSAFYKKINPLQKVPALSVNGEIICDSHAIALYFCRMSEWQEMYPEPTMLRTKVDEWMYFNAGYLFPIDSAIFNDFFSGIWPADVVKVNNWYSALDHLERKLNEQKWLTGDRMRLCDVCCGITVSSLELLVPLLPRHQNIKEWLVMLKSLTCFEVNKRGLERLQSFIDIKNLLKT